MNRFIGFIFGLLSIAGYVVMAYGLFNGHGIEQIFKYFILGHLIRTIGEIYATVAGLYYNVFGYPTETYD